MATAYSSAQAASGAPVIAPMNGCSATIFGSFTWAAAFVINDTVDLVQVPNGYRIVDLTFDTDQIDSATSLTLDLGDTGASARYLSANATVGRGANGASANAVAMGGGMLSQTLGQTYSIATTGGNSGTTKITLKIHAAPGTGTTSGTMRLAAQIQQDSGQASAPFS